jgi:hypothetical protein
VVQQVIDAAEEYIRGYRCEAFGPSRHETGRNTQENGESLCATFQKGNSCYDPLVSLLLHRTPAYRPCAFSDTLSMGPLHQAICPRGAKRGGPSSSVAPRGPRPRTSRGSLVPAKSG